MPLALALLEGAVLFLALGAVLLAGRWLGYQGGLRAIEAVRLAAGLTVGLVAALYYADCYERRVVPTFRSFLRRLPRCLAAAAVAFGLCLVLTPEAWRPLMLAAVVMVALVPLVRAVAYRVLGTPWFVKRVLIVGWSELAQHVVEAIEEHGCGRYVIVGVAEDELRVSGAIHYPLLGPLEHLDQVIEVTAPDRIVVALEERRGRLPVRPLLEARLRGLAVEEGVELYERLTGKIAIEALTPSSLIFSRNFQPAPVARAIGRVVSVGVAAFGLLALLPVFGVLALAIRLESPGPVFFIHERVGLRGRRFPLIKFRTMRDDAPARSEWARDNGHRVTRLGRWLRRFRLDELPQFINILRGDMDLVGPRPHPITNFSLFVTVLRNSPECGEQIPYYSLRGMVRPGITGWAQVRYRYANNLEEEIEKMRYDLYYVKHRSLWLDIRILADTAKTVLAGRGAVEAPARGGARAGRRDAWTLAPRPR